jgi:cytochrome c oxidase subunit 2
MSTRASSWSAHAACALILAWTSACRSSHEEPAAAPPAAALPATATPVVVTPAVTAPVVATSTSERVVQITAKKFEYSPSSITLKKGEPVMLELVSLDRVHGFNAPDFGLRTDVKPDANVRLRFVPDKTGRFEFHCDVFCGAGHEDMTGEIIVEN